MTWGWTRARWLYPMGVALCFGCDWPEAREPASAFEPPEGVESAARADSGTEPTPLDPGMLSTVATTPVSLPPYTDEHPFEVALRTGEQVAGHHRRFGAITRSIALRIRTPDLSQYPCTSCHLGITVAMADERVQDAHQNIKPVHPQATGAVCSTCHAPDDVEKLAVKSGERPTLDHGYRLCAQCHFPEVDAWAGGGHGKRLDGWRGRRVVMNCTDCHDPHNPAVEPRTPFRAPRLPSSGSH
ncbi:MAG: hypothetical protein AB7R55_05675 [Gemmatimonadales bacterium]